MAASQAKHSDSLLGITVAVLVLVGIVMVFSSSAVYAMEKYNDSYYFLKRQAVWCLLGTGALLVTKNLDYHKRHQHTYLIMVTTFLLLLSVMFPAI
ncbi:MAG: FtsW/RodA/SpoVE family cell cycle protein, partial [Nitrospinae bacterium]|nr:FtsW/RodA/SpoVE family cell cycle protein [Nitrospinota bacterium]